MRVIFSETEEDIQDPSGISGPRKKRKKIRQQQLDFLLDKTVQGVYRDRKLADFMELYHYIESPEVMVNGRLVDSKAFRAADSQTRSMEFLHDTRNRLVHFQPNTSISVSVHLFPPVLADCMDIVSFLAFECHNILWPPDQLLADQTRKLITAIKSTAESLQDELLAKSDPE